MFSMGYVMQRELGLNDRGYLHSMMPVLRFRPMCKSTGAMGQGPRRYQYPTYIVLFLDAVHWKKQIVECYGFNEEQLAAFEKHIVPYTINKKHRMHHECSLDEVNAFVTDTNVLHIPGITAPVFPIFYYKYDNRNMYYLDEDKDDIVKLSKEVTVQKNHSIRRIYPDTNADQLLCINNALVVVKVPCFRTAALFEQMFCTMNDGWHEARKEAAFTEVDYSLKKYIKNSNSEIIVMY